MLLSSLKWGAMKLALFILVFSNRKFYKINPPAFIISILLIFINIKDCELLAR